MGRRMKRRFGGRRVRRRAAGKAQASAPVQGCVASPQRVHVLPQADDPPFVRYWRYFPLEERQ